MSISPRVWMPIASFVDRLLAPLGLIMWTSYSADEGPGGAPINLRVTGFSIGLRPYLGRAIWAAKRREDRKP